MIPAITGIITDILLNTAVMATPAFWDESAKRKKVRIKIKPISIE